MIDRPIYYKNEGPKYRSSPKELKALVLQYYPITREFINWVAEQGFEISYFLDWREGTGAVWWSLRRIAVSSQGEQKIIDQTLLHEIVHITIPGVPNGWGWWGEDKKIEEAIDEIADTYLEDSELVEYIKKKIPVYKKKKKPA